MNILIADDQPVYRAGMEMTIKKLNPAFGIMHASNGLEVLELVRHKSVDFIFMQTKMPLLNGIETTCRIRNTNPLVKIIALSLNDDRRDAIAMFRAGANGYMLKNASVEKIETALKTIIKGGNYFTEEVRCFFSGSVLEKCRQKLDKSLRQELSDREKEILVLICLQFSTKEISEQTGLSVKTIEIHRKHILEKTHSKNMVGLVLYALEKSIFNPSVPGVQIVFN